MSNIYKPKQRAVPSSILTIAGFVDGNLHILKKAALLEELNAVSENFQTNRRIYQRFRAENQFSRFATQFRNLYIAR